MRNFTVDAFNCSTYIWWAVKFPTYGASFSVKTGQMPHLFPYIAREGGIVGHNIDRCITLKLQLLNNQSVNWNVIIIKTVRIAIYIAIEQLHKQLF